MKRCPFCAEEIQDAAVKCRFCNSMLDGSTATPASPAAVQVHGVIHEPPDTGASPIFGGSPSWKAQFWGYTGAFLAILVGIAAGGALPTVFRSPWRDALIGGGALAGLGLVWWLGLELRRRSIHYRIDTRTIDIESGVLSRKIETTQLWKVKDIEFQQSLFDRILNVAHIDILTHDAANPSFRLWGLPESRELFDKLKDAIAISRQGRNVVGVMQ